MLGGKEKLACNKRVTRGEKNEIYGDWRECSHAGSGRVNILGSGWEG